MTIKKSVGDNAVGFKSSIDQHIRNYRTGTFTCQFATNCAMENKCLKEPYFQLNMMIKLKSSWQLEFYENHFPKKSNNTINNCPEYLKEHFNKLKLVYLANT